MDSLQVFQPSGGALSAESYQTFELAKENDAILGGDSIAQIRSYAAYARAQAQAIHKTIAATSGIEDVAAIKQEALETEQTFAKVGIYADQRIGEILRELPTRQGARTDKTSVEITTKVKAEREAGLDHHTAVDLQALAANPEIVQAVLDKAEAEGRVASRAQVLKAIRERDALKEEVEALEKQNDQLYEQATRNAEPKVVERQVVPADYQSVRHERDVYLADVQKLRKRNEDMRKELERAKVLLGEKERTDSANWDIAALTTATNNYLRQYGGKAWAFDQFYRVDATTQAEFTKAINNLAAFAQNLAQMIREQSNE